MYEEKINMMDEALKYVRKSWSIIPVGGGEDGKSPYVQTWAEFQKRLPTEAEVRSWWTQWPNANIAVVTGKISGIAVVDVDCKHNDPSDPTKVTEQGSTKGLPPTLVARTGGGGWHFFYQYPEGLSSKIGIDRLVDIKADGGYIILAPSLHKSGNRYEWVVIEDLQPFPMETFNLFDHKYKNTDWSSLVEGVPVGERNKAAAQLVGKLIKTFKPAEWGAAVWPMVVYWNKGLSQPLLETELRAVFNSITNREQRALQGATEEVGDEDVVLPMSEVVRMLKDDTSVAYPTGYQAVDEAFNGGMHDGDLIVVTGKSGFGKTTLAQSISFRLAQNKTPCLWFSYEVLLKELWGKFESMGAEEDLMTYTPIKNTSGKIDWISKKIIEAKEKYKIKVVFIDHLGFLTPSLDNKSVSANYSLYLGAICRELKKVAIDQEIIVVLLVHLRKSNNDDPNMDDIGHSAAISQESDAILLVNRKSRTPTDDDPSLYRDVSKLKILKNRRTGIAKEVDIKMRNGLLMDLTEAEVTDERELDKKEVKKAKEFSQLKKSKNEDLNNLPTDPSWGPFQDKVDEESGE